jgi:hypothetical protein
MAIGFLRENSKIFSAESYTFCVLPMRIVTALSAANARADRFTIAISAVILALGAPPPLCREHSYFMSTFCRQGCGTRFSTFQAALSGKFDAWTVRNRLGFAYFPNRKIDNQLAELV